MSTTEKILKYSLYIPMLQHGEKTYNIYIFSVDSVDKKYFFCLCFKNAIVKKINSSLKKIELY